MLQAKVKSEIDIKEINLKGKQVNMSVTWNQAEVTSSFSPMKILCGYCESYMFLLFTLGCQNCTELGLCLPSRSIQYLGGLCSVCQA